MAVFQEKIVIGRRRILNLIFSVLFVYAMLVLFLFFNQRSFIYHPDRNRMSMIEAGVPEMEVMAVLPDGMEQSIDGWYRPPADPSKPVILFFHGNAGGIDIRTPRVIPLMKEGYGVLLAEYRGYGGNSGKPTEKGFYADADAYYDWLIKQGVPEDKIVVYGESLGSGVATYLAAKHHNIRGLVLEAPFTSMTDIAQARMFFVPVIFMLLDRYPSIDRIDDINVPLLVMHGERDGVVPVRYGKKLYEAANQPKMLRLYPEAGHNDLYQHGAGADVLRFLKSDNP